MPEEPWVEAERYFAALDAEMEWWPVCDVCGEPIPPDTEYYEFPVLPFTEDKVCDNCLREYLRDKGYATFWEEKG